MRLFPFLFLFSFLFAVSTANLLNVPEPEFFDIVIDRDHPDKLYKAFEDFIVKYKRKYGTPQEKTARFNNFVKTFNQVNQLNKKSETAGMNTKFAINKFSDWTSSEFSATLSHVPPTNMSQIKPLKFDGFVRDLSGNKTAGVRPKRQSTRYPDFFDLRDAEIRGESVVGPIKNQGGCACCWGFAVTAVMETVNAVNNGGFTSLSDQEICDCATDGTPGCVGGALDMGVNYVSRYGQSSDDEYPYDEHRAHVSKRCRLKNTERVIPARAMEFVRINSDRAEEEIMYILVNWKVPVAVYFKVGNAFKLYERNVLSIEDCHQSTEWHAGAIVGYGTNRDERGRRQDYWIIKNSWGAGDWGEGGYIRIVKGRNWCEIEASPVTGDMGGH